MRGGLTLARLYTVKELAKYFQKDPETIYRWIKDGTVFPHAFKVKDGWFVPISDVQNVIKSQTVNSYKPHCAIKSESIPIRAGFVNRWKL